MPACVTKKDSTAKAWRAEDEDLSTACARCGGHCLATRHVGSLWRAEGVSLVDTCLFASAPRSNTYTQRRSVSYKSNKQTEAYFQWTTATKRQHRPHIIGLLAEVANAWKNMGDESPFVSTSLRPSVALGRIATAADSRHDSRH